MMRLKYKLECLVLIFGALVQLSQQQSCKKKSSCSCEGSSGVIDLSPLANTGGPKFKDMKGKKGDWLFSWNPCKPFTEGTCKGVAGCQVPPSTTGTSYNIGTQDSATFSDGSSGSQVITYKATTDVERTLHVTLNCDKTEEAKLEALGEVDPRVYGMNLTSKYACPSGGGGGGGGGSGSSSLSAGSIILIGFIVILLLYVIAGVAFQAGVRKARGKEMAPNYDFWAVVPGLIKDGFMFTFTCGRRSGYSRA